MRFSFIKTETPELHIEIDGNDLAELLEKGVIRMAFGNYELRLIKEDGAKEALEESAEVCRKVLEHSYEVFLRVDKLYQLIRTYEIVHSFDEEPSVVKIKLNTRGR